MELTARRRLQLTPADMPALLADGLRMSWAEGFSAAGYPTYPVPFVPALRLAMEEPGVLRKWARGEDTFADLRAC